MVAAGFSNMIVNIEHIIINYLLCIAPEQVPNVVFVLTNSQPVYEVEADDELLDFVCVTSIIFFFLVSITRFTAIYAIIPRAS